MQNLDVHTRRYSSLLMTRRILSLSLITAAQILRASQLKPLRDSAQPRRVLFNIVHLRDL